MERSNDPIYVALYIIGVTTQDTVYNLVRVFLFDDVFRQDTTVVFVPVDAAGGHLSEGAEFRTGFGELQQPKRTEIVSLEDGK